MEPAQQITEVAGYRLAERIGSGGMGDVYKAYNAALNRQAAVKILHQAAFADRFKNEAYIQSSINHPNIARLYEYTKIGSRQCIIMEYVEGLPLDIILHKKGKFSCNEAESILQQIIAALKYLHINNIIHRDIKPSNFKLQADGTVKMLDFGIAKHKYSPKLTQLGFVVGTMEYLAPEQFEQKEELKSDVWSFAVMAYELLTGYMPFEASNPLTLRAKITKGSFTNPKILVPAITEKLSVIIDKGLKVNPVNRITAAGIENILGKRKATAGIKLNKKQFQFQLPQRKILVPAIAVLGLLLLFWLVVNNKPGLDSLNPGDPDKNRDERKITINVPGISNAELIFNNNEHWQLPYSLSGNYGDKFEFTIHADGYKDKKVELVIMPQRSSFEYNLEKIND
jgi:serine/threonine protein kinase